MQEINEPKILELLNGKISLIQMQPQLFTYAAKKIAPSRTKIVNTGAIVQLDRREPEL
jgi:hypothetical protein